MAVSTSAATVYPRMRGIDPRYMFQPTVERLPPHARIDPLRQVTPTCGSFTPHARGSTCHLYRTDSHIPVYPVWRGSTRTSSTCCAGKSSLLPHAGDRPWRQVFKSCLSWFTPPWDRTSCIASYSTNLKFTPHAGIDRTLVVRIGMGCVFTPHAAGFSDLSPCAFALVTSFCGLPRMRGIDLLTR